MSNQFKDCALRKLTEEELIRLRMEKRILKAFEHANTVDKCHQLSSKQIRQQIKTIWAVPLESLKKLLPDSDKSSNITVTDIFRVLLKRFKNHLPGFLKATSAS